MNTRKSMLLVSLVVFGLLAHGPVMAQSTLMNVPSTDVVAAKKGLC
jgi:hypothetical protein